MKILVINAGSSSLKYQLIDMDTEQAVLKGICERITFKGGELTQKTADGKVLNVKQDMKDHTAAIELVLKAMVDPVYGAIKSTDEISAVGHRVLHSGEDFNSSVVIDDEVIRICEKNAELGPLHMPGNIACIKSCRKVMPGVPMVAVFDTTFHSTMPAKAYMYGIPYSVYDQYKVRKYGFHGTSHKFVSEETIKLLGKKDSKIIVCHLGNGSSISAVKDGKCLDTSMGFTPLEGLVMGTRSGDIDPAACEFIRAKLGLTPEELVQYLNKKCGMLGVSELSSDMRDLEKGINEGNEKAKLAVEVAAYRIKKYIGSYAATLNGVDAIVFTGGIGEHSDLMRRLVMEGMEYLGVDFDFEANKEHSDGVRVLSKPDSKVKVFILPTNEELSIARETKELVM
ncbi:MAG TPA: acetate kinase [Clostridiales bacterium]|nr:acetate kinase [Clostridiales bacterium]HBW05161.1 acetate kinase [Clostridiales bacterium]HCH92424.1 acetate kinase [Clostridiales bacterium]